MEEIQVYFNKKKAKNPHFTLGVLAKKMEVSVPYLSQVMKGEKHFTLKRALQFAQSVDLTKTETKNFIKKLSLSRIKSVKERVLVEENLAPKKRKILKLTFSDAQLFLSQWYYLAILDITNCTNFVSDTSWIAKRLNLKVEEVKEALFNLQQIGLLECVDGLWKKVDLDLDWPTFKSNSIVRKLHLQMSQLALKILQNHAEDPSSEKEFLKREISCITFTADPSKINLAKEMIKEFKLKLADAMEEGETTEIYQLNIQLFPLTH